MSADETSEVFEPQVRIVDGGGAPAVEFLPPANRPTGPSPYAHLLAGLGTCTTLTLRMYAARQSWPLEGIVVELQHRKIAVPGSDAKTDRFDRVISLDGALSAEQQAKLLSIAEKCPVSRTLAQASPIVSRLN